MRSISSEKVYVDSEQLEMTPAPSCRWGEHLVYTNIHEGQTCPVQRHIDVIQGAVTLLITVIDSLVFGCLRKYVEHTKVH